MYTHFWYTVDSGMGIRCDKCDAYTNMLYTEEFNEIESKKDCPVPDNLAEPYSVLYKKNR